LVVFFSVKLYGNILIYMLANLLEVICSLLFGSVLPIRLLRR
jgi:hypothetical protein